MRRSEPTTTSTHWRLRASGVRPTDLRNAYGITADGTATIAIVDAYGYTNAESDLAAYRAQFGLPPSCTPDPAPHRVL